MAVNNKEHEELCDGILIAVGGLPQVRLWKRKVGFAVPYRSTSDRPIFFGTKGESDLQGIIAPRGRMIAIEVKTGKAKLSDDQITWRNMVVKFGGLYIVAHSVEEALQCVLREIASNHGTGRGLQASLS